MRTRFRVDLLHPGAGLRQRGAVSQAGAQWFVGPSGVKRLAVFTLACAAVLVIVFVVLILPPYWRLSGDLSALARAPPRSWPPGTPTSRTLRSNIGALTEEARRQVRWADLLVTLSQQIPASMKLHLVDAGRGVGESRRAAAAAGAGGAQENTIRIDAVTPLRPGSAPLLEVAQFMAGVMRDPAVNKPVPIEELGDQARPAGRRRRLPTAPEHQHHLVGAPPMKSRLVAIAWIVVAFLFVVLLLAEYSRWRSLATEGVRARAERQQLAAEIQLREQQLVGEMRKHSALLQEMQWTSSGADPSTFLARMADLAKEKRMKVMGIGPLEKQSSAQFTKTWHTIQVQAPYREIRRARQSRRARQGNHRGRASGGGAAGARPVGDARRAPPLRTRSRPGSR